MASAAHICAINRADNGTYTVGSAAGTLPVTNLKDRQLTAIWRSTTLTAPTQTPTSFRDTTAGRTWIECDLGGGQLINVLSLMAHNISQNGLIRIRLSSVSNFSVLDYDSGQVSAWPSIGGYGTLPWGVWNWGDLLGVSEATYYTIFSYFVLPTAIVSRYIRIDINDTSNPAGYIQAGRFWAGPSWQPSQNIQFGWEIGWVDSSQVQYSLGGQAYIDQRAKRRIMKFSLMHLNAAEIYSNAFDFIDRRKGIAGDLLIIPQPDNPELYIHEVVYGRMQTLNPITNPDYSGRSKQFVLEEIV